MSFKEALVLIGGISSPSKMPFGSWSTSAFDCKVGTKLRAVKGSTCSSCYATRGNYGFKNVKEAHNRRLAALSDPRFVEAFVIVLKSLYKHTKKTYLFEGKEIKENRWRWHDSGDLQSLDHLVMINDIALQTPFLVHWIPTREIGIVNEYLKSGRTFASNLLVRISATMVGQTYATRPMGLPFSTVGVDAAPAQCPAYQQGGKCLDCSNCWDATKDVNYSLH